MKKKNPKTGKNVYHNFMYLLSNFCFEAKKVNYKSKYFLMCGKNVKISFIQS